MKQVYRIREQNNEFFFSKEKDTRTWFDKAAENGLKFKDEFNAPYRENENNSPFHKEINKYYRCINPFTQKEETIKFSKIIVL